MKRQKTVFLFGAGAVLDWGGPRTLCNGSDLTFLPEHDHPEIVKNRVCCLTHLVTSTGFRTKENVRVTFKIYERLQKEQPLKAINFEDIVHFIEEMFALFSNVHDRNTISQQHPTAEWFTEQMHFTVSNVNSISGTYSFSIPGYEYPKDDFLSTDISPEQKYCEWLLDGILEGIVGHVSKYSFHSPRHSLIFNSVNDRLNRQFAEWMKKYLGDNGIIRLYTLNYDRLFAILLEEAGLNIFEGFSAKSQYVDDSMFMTDPKRIITDFDSHVHYNLHGSATWRVQGMHDWQHPSYQYFQTHLPHAQTGSNSVIVELERRRKFLLSNIISGYQKIQKTFLSPFRQMLAAYDRDCFEATELVIVGYSFFDEHINEIIRNARKYNRKMRITCINPLFNDEKFLTDFLLYWGDLTIIPFKNDGRNVVSQPYNAVFVKQTFGEYLMDIQANPSTGT